MRILQNDDIEDNAETSKPELDPEIIKKLESGFRRLIWSRDCSTLLKQCLTKNVFEALKTRQTVSGATLYDVIQVVNKINFNISFIFNRKNFQPPFFQRAYIDFKN
jgi:hypothetical protein